MSKYECVICCVESELFGIGRCGHNEVCALCHYKLRVKQNNIACGLCKANNEEIIITDDENLGFEDYDLQECIEFDLGTIYFGTGAQMKKFEKLISTRCPIPNCPDKEAEFSAIAYKKHLREKHKKHVW